MGQRHQIFMVARVRVAPGKPRQYRCIAAIHHQWCYGKLPLYAVNSFKHLARVPENATLIEEELATYHERIANAPEEPCPYTGYLAESAFSVDLMRDSGPYSSGVGTLPADMGSRDGDNNDGITVLDVSIPRNPAYCFVSIYGLEGERDIHPHMIPLTAAQYLRSYYPSRIREEYALASEALQEKYCLETIANLDDMPLITIETLAEVWPDEYSAQKGKIKASESSNTGETDPAQSTNSAAHDQSTAYPADIDALRKQSALSTEDLARLTSTLKGRLNPNGIVDLSRFPLTADQVLSTLKDFPDLKRLDISHCQAVNRDFLLHLLKTYGRLRWINVLHCPISEDDLEDLAVDNPRRFRSIEAILHPTFLQQTIPVTFPMAFGICISRSHRGGIRYIGLPFFVVDQLVQNMLDIFSNGHDYVTHGSILGSLHRSPDQSWQDRVIQNLPVFCSGRKAGERFRAGYRLVMFADEKKYGVLPPLPTEPEGVEYIDSDIIGLDAFLQRLEEEGTQATDTGAVNRLLELFADATLLTAKEVKEWEGSGGY